MKKSAKSTKTAAKSAVVSKSEKFGRALQAKNRSMAAYKAHITRQTQLIAASKSASVKSEAREAIRSITANMKAA